MGFNCPDRISAASCGIRSWPVHQAKTIKSDIRTYKRGDTNKEKHCCGRRALALCTLATAVFASDFYYLGASVGQSKFDTESCGDLDDGSLVTCSINNSDIGFKVDVLIILAPPTASFSKLWWVENKRSALALCQRRIFILEY